MGLSDLTGVPWHTERFTRAEGDERRHRSNCTYFRKSESFCELYNERCHGSAHCNKYKFKQNSDSIERIIPTTNINKSCRCNTLNEKQKGKLILVP